MADPANPVLVTKLSQGLKDTHKNFWECDTGIAYLVSGAPGWRARRMLAAAGGDAGRIREYSHEEAERLRDQLGAPIVERAWEYYAWAAGKRALDR